VLYFAQHIVTNLDEEARQKALKRLEDGFQEEQERLEGASQEQIAALEQELAREEARVDEQLEALEARLDEELATATEEVIQEAQALQKKVEERQGETLRAPLVFKPTGEIIVESGETVGREHQTLLNQVVQDHLSELEAGVRVRREEQGAPLEGERARWREATAEAVERIQEQLVVDTAALRVRLKADREELLGLAELQFLNEPRLRELKSKWGQVFKAGMGAEAFYEILYRLDLDKLAEELWHEVRHGTSKQRRKRATRRLRVVEALRKSGNRPEWMVLTVLPVIPPDLRPMVQLDGGRFATSDLNDLYRRVINRNNRLKRLLDLGAPDVIVRNEKRMLQEAVDSLIDNSRRGKARSRRGRRELKSLSDMLKGKKGRFRRNLLGKRVDYSGRSVIVIGPQLKLHQCGLPKMMALELYRPFVISKLVEYNYASNVKASKRIIERERPEVWEVLEEVIRDRPVFLNRAPTLHRLGIQAFEPVLVEGKAIQIHPLVCAAFNADFDGDQMAVHVPLSQRAVEEARQLMLATHNLLKPADGQPVVGPTKDMCLGVYYLTMEEEGAEAGRRPFVDLDEVEVAYTLGQVDLHTPVVVARVYDERAGDGEAVETTVGRCLFNRILPDELRFINRAMDKGTLQELVGVCYRRLGSEVTTEVVDQIKHIGFEYATRSGVTIAISDLAIPTRKAAIIAETEGIVAEVERQYRRGLLTEEEQYTRTIELWSRAREQVSEAVSENLAPTGSVAIMAKSGASKGGFGPIAQLAGMRGLMADPSGRIIPLPIRSNLREGLSALEYFISTHGSRKGLADTALRTADAGYLTRRLVDVAQDMIVNAQDCGTRGGVWVRAEDDVGGQRMSERLLGRVAAAAVVHPETGEVLVERNGGIDEELAADLEGAGVEAVLVRSPMTCQLRQGICAQCYGRDLGRGERVAIGAAVGIIAAQSIGEPGTQLTLRTFHTGGVAAGGDITVGLPRVEELFEARKTPKGEAAISEMGGVVHIARARGQVSVIVVDSEIETFEHEIKRGGWKILVEDGDEVKAGEAIAAWREEKYVEAEKSGRVSVEGRQVTIVHERREEEEYDVPKASRLLVEEGQRIEPGAQLVEGVLNPRHILRVLGREATEKYLLCEVQRVYRSQGVNINDKHFEVIFRKMLNKVQITDSGDTELLPGEMVNRLALEDANRAVVEVGGEPAKGWPLLLGITKAALNTESYLSAASFQHTIRVLSEAAVEGKEDSLLGLKENVILGKLIPAGTGYRGNNPASDGPIESYEGISLKSLEVGQEEEEPEPELAEAEGAPEAEEESAEEQPEEEPTAETSDILGLAAVAS